MGGNPALITSVFGSVLGALGPGQKAPGGSDQAAELAAERKRQEEEQRKKEALERKRQRDKLTEARAVEKKRLAGAASARAGAGASTDPLSGTGHPGDIPANAALKTRLGE
jgi:hypothetical protein